MCYVSGVLESTNCMIVSAPTALILGGPDLHVDKGSTINLTCTVHFSPEPPAYIFWYHEDNVRIKSQFWKSYFFWRSKSNILASNANCARRYEVSRLINYCESCL